MLSLIQITGSVTSCYFAPAVPTERVCAAKDWTLLVFLLFFQQGSAFPDRFSPTEEALGTSVIGSERD